MILHHLLLGWAPEDLEDDKQIEAWNSFLRRCCSTLSTQMALCSQCNALGSAAGPHTGQLETSHLNKKQFVNHPYFTIISNLASQSQQDYHKVRELLHFSRNLWLNRQSGWTCDCTGPRICGNLVGRGHTPPSSEVMRSPHLARGIHCLQFTTRTEKTWQNHYLF